MRFCAFFHADELRGQVISKGMGGLIADDDGNVVERARAELAIAAPVATYDPLMVAHWAIVGKALEEGGVYLMFDRPGDGGEYCPLCEVEDAGVREGKVGLSLAWMEGCTDSILVYCRQQGLLSKPQ